MLWSLDPLLGPSYSGLASSTPTPRRTCPAGPSDGGHGHWRGGAGARCPISPRPAFPHDHSPFLERTLDIDGESRAYVEQLFWAGVITAAYLPSTVFPTGLSREGLPIGLQAVGREYHDHTCIDFTRLVAEEMGGFTPPPGYAD